MPNSLVCLIAFVAAAFVAAGLTKIHLRWSGRLSHFASPDAFHGTPAALSGGVGIWIAFLLITALGGGTATLNWLIIVPSLAMFAVGLWDDLRPLAPQQKLLLQILVRAGGVALGLQFDTPGLEVLGVPLSILWLVSLANAFNLIDNMDGLAPGVAALAGIFLSVHAWAQGSSGVAVATAAFAGAHAGFLPFNFKPARIFLGDCGSMAAGFFLSAASMAGTWRDASSVLFVILAPALIFAVPIFNMVFIIITRKLSGVSVSRGRADHISYRLVAYGLSERKSVIFIYILSAACGVLALGYSRLGSVTLMALAGIVTMAFLYLGIFLYEASVRSFYSDFGVAQQGAVDLTKLPFTQYWWRLFQVLSDFILISVGYYLAYLLRFEGSLPPAQERNFILTLPYFILVKTVIFSQFRLYGSHWRYVGINDLLKILKAVGLSALVLVAGTALIRLEFFSRSVLAIDAIVAVLLVGGSRVLLRVFREFIVEARSKDALVRTIIVGAGESGELMLRMAQHDAKLGLNVVGFLDDNARKAQTIIHGVRVLGPTSALPRICRDLRPELAIVAMSSAPQERIGEIAGLCHEVGVQCKVLSFKLADYVPTASGDGARR
jgi:UDP-GlcNAc:undecaprenyl-phosphate GlcNAc-1-phosphate transferase